MQEAASCHGDSVRKECQWRLPVSGKLMPTHTGFTVPNIKLAQASADAKVGEMVDDRTVGSGGGAQRLAQKAHDT
jgi:hypothetical protein